MLLLAYPLLTFPVRSQSQMDLTPFMGKNSLSHTVTIDSTIQVLSAGITSSLKDQDTTKAISQMVILSDIYANNAMFGKSYDGYWSALLLADQSRDLPSKSLIYHGLGWLYSLYLRENLAIEYFNRSLQINKQFADSGQAPKTILLRDYYSLVTLHRKLNHIDIARQYLDSCRMIKDAPSTQPKRNAFHDAEEGYLLFLENKPTESLALLNETKLYFEKNQDSYLAILYSFLGDIYQSLGQYELSRRNYLASLQIIDRYKRHVDWKPGIYENLSENYHLAGDDRQAYRMMKLSKQFTEQQFGSRSSTNRELLEIKDQFRLEKERQQDLLQQQELEKLEGEKKIENLKAIILFISLIFLTFSGLLIYRYLRSKHKAEKKWLQQQQELERIKAREILEIKNKELTTSTLRIIEKEELLADLKEKLTNQKQQPNPGEINKLLKTIDTSTYNNWEEFEARFSSVNESFYKNLAEQFPNLSHSDKKICALIKLNFSSKDMARLLGISTESVHTTRYRVRKKLNLSREVNLYEFIQNL
ncbi:hypothetical protein CLV98_102415 [Dyadobacter jejuensis]|uniref:HTH luxR-type domain-containing protein n=1 Tax=Dyadobacter jejuensis TaxID=1082580 RepID=A0A316AQ26_9BACT|nr:hypothetical protein CLV98_102415 [Dyadobacter jejuensis]